MATPVPYTKTTPRARAAAPEGVGLRRARVGDCLGEDKAGGDDSGVADLVILGSGGPCTFRYAVGGVARISAQPEFEAIREARGVLLPSSKAGHGSQRRRTGGARSGKS